MLFANFFWLFSLGVGSMTLLGALAFEWCHVTSAGLRVVRVTGLLLSQSI